MSTLLCCRQIGKLPAEVKSWHGLGDVVEAKRKAVGAIKEVEKRAAREISVNVRQKIEIGNVEGLLLYQDKEIRDMIDLKLFLRTSQAVAKARRIKRPGYEDPEIKDFWRIKGYFEDCVWANYVKENGRLFGERNVDGRVNEETCKNERILVQPATDVTVQETSDWAVKTPCELLTVQDG